MLPTLNRYSAAALLALVLCACGGAKPEVPLTNELAMPVVRALVASIGAGNREYFNDKLDSTAFVERATRKLKLTSEDLLAAKTGIFRKINMGKFMVDDVDRGGRYKFLRLHKVDGEMRALVRILTPGGDLNYHDIVLGFRGESTDVAVKDVFVYRRGDLLSGSLGVVIRDAVESELHPGGRRSDGLIEVLDSINRMVKDGRTVAARAYCGSLRPGIRSAKAVQQLYLALCSIESREAYHAAVDEYVRFYPRDTGSALLLAERDMMEGKFAEAMASIDKLNTIVGGDPYLDGLRVYAMIGAGDTVGAMARARKAIAAEPDMAEVYWPCIDLLVARGENAEAVRMLGELERGAHGTHEQIEMEIEIRAGAGYRKFLASREFAAWRDR